MRTKKSRWPIILSIAVLALGFGGFAAYKAAIQSFKGKIEQALGPQGEVKEIRVSLTGVEIIDLRIRATSGNNTTSWPAEDELRATRILVLPSFADLITGKIVIEKLRIGEYTVTELKNSASEGYKIADPVKITLVAHETLTVKIHNDKTKVDVPKTGDDADLMLWISLLGLAAAGVGCTAFFYLKKRRTGKHVAVKK